MNEKELTEHYKKTDPSQIAQPGDLIRDIVDGTISINQDVDYLLRDREEIVDPYEDLSQGSISVTLPISGPAAGSPPTLLEEALGLAPFVKK